MPEIAQHDGQEFWILPRISVVEVDDFGDASVQMLTCVAREVKGRQTIILKNKQNVTVAVFVAGADDAVQGDGAGHGGRQGGGPGEGPPDAGGRGRTDHQRTK